MENRTWKYRTWNDNREITYNNGKLTIFFDTGKLKFRDVTWLEFFNYEFSVTTLIVDAKIRQLLIDKHTVPAEWEKQQKWNWEFWAALDTNKIPGQRFRFIQENYFNSNITLGLNDTGMWQEIDVRWQEEPSISNQQPLHTVFFAGPRTHCIPLEIRKEIRNILWNALDKDKISFTLSDAFPLIDYSKVGTIHFEKSMGIEGVFIELKGDHINIGGWSNPRDGGASPYSLEYILAYPKYIPSELKTHTDKILKMIKEGFIDA